MLIFVTGYNGTIHPGAVSIKVTAAGICPAVENLTLTPSAGQIALTWDSSPDAERYLIYARRASGAYCQLIRRTDDEDSIDYVDAFYNEYFNPIYFSLSSFMAL